MDGASQERADFAGVQCYTNSLEAFHQLAKAPGDRGVDQARQGRKREGSPARVIRSIMEQCIHRHRFEPSDFDL